MNETPPAAILRATGARPCRIQGQVQVWAFHTQDVSQAVPLLSGLLSEDERRQVDRYRTAADRLRAVVSRGMLRLLLGWWLGADAPGLSIGRTAAGRPFVHNMDDTLDFNVAHSGDWVLIALSSGGRVGVDVEFVRPVPELDAIVERHFAGAESEALRRLPRQYRTEAFFALWTRKEACLKAEGTGLQQPLNQFRFELGDGVPALHSVAGSRREAQAWTLADAAPAEGYAGAVAVRGAQVKLTLHDGTGAAGAHLLGQLERS
jgi:4'-phosphopantetheinyl transferase